MKIQIALAVLVLSSATALADEKTCLTAAFTEYNKANLAIMTQVTTVMSVEATVAQRRLQEQYCIRVAQCRTTSPMALAATFSRCLDDEGKNK
jgi:hypothetical protein